MGGTGALRFARHANGCVTALVPQINVNGFEYSSRADFTSERKERLRAAIRDACESASAQINVHVGQDSADLRQLDYLPRVPRGLCITRHSIEGHALGAGLKEKGILKKVVLGSLFEGAGACRSDGEGEGERAERSRAERANDNRASE